MLRTEAGGPEHGCCAAESGEINNLGTREKGGKREGKGGGMKGEGMSMWITHLTATNSMGRKIRHK